MSLTWLGNVADYWRFIGSRRSDSSSKIVSAIPLTGYLLSVLVIVIFLYVYVDPKFLFEVQNEATAKKPFWLFVTEIGKSEWLLVPTGLIILLIPFLNIKAASRNRKQNIHGIFLRAYFVFGSVAFSGILVQLLKAIFGRARPPVADLGAVWQSRPFELGYEFSSFPSGHSCTAGAATVAFVLLFPKLRWILFPLGLLIAYSRVALEVHFPSDIVAGYAFGVAFAYIFARTFAQKRLLFEFTSGGYLRLIDRDRL